MIRCFICLVALASCLVASSHAMAEGVTPLEVSILEPALPVTTSDTIQFQVEAPELGFPDPGEIYTSSFIVDGFDIQWVVQTEWVRSPRPVAVPMVHAAELDPLPAGDYQLTANWTLVGDHVPDLYPTSGTGTISFSVVPEPTALSLLVAGALGMAVFFRRR